MAAASWLRVVDRPADSTLLARLDPGEAAAIPLAAELGALLLVDDGEARAVAAERAVGTCGRHVRSGICCGHLDALVAGLYR